MSNKFEVGKTYVVLKDFNDYPIGYTFTANDIDVDGNVRDGKVYVAYARRLTQGFVKLKEENVMSNTITQLEQQAADLQKKLDEMKATIEQQKQAEQESKKKENVFGLGGIGMHESYYYLGCGESSNLDAFGCGRGHTDDAAYTTAFNDRTKAKAMAEAFNVLLELRACDGVVEAKYCMLQYYIDFYKDGTVGIDTYNNVSGSLSPLFESQKVAQDALDKVGKKRVRKAFLAMQGSF